MAATGQRIVGRKEELARVDHALEALAESEEAGVVEISGEAGIGKTCLLDELCDRADQRDYLVLRGRAAEFERGVPFAPVVEAFDAYLASLDPGRLKLPEGELRDELGAVFPSLRTTRTHSRAVQDERYRAYRAVRELLERLAAPRPLIVAIDDLQWADDASAELISALLRKPPPASVMLALSGRSGQAPDPIEPALGAAHRRFGAHRLRLGPLDEHEADEMLSDRLPAPLRGAVFEAGGGNPFFMEQLARASAVETRATPAMESPGLEVPPAIAAALAEELGALPDDTRAMLQAAAIAGERFEPDLVADIAGAEESVVLTALDELLDRELVRPTEVPRRFAFRHPLVWRAVYEGAKGGWRLSAHAAAADALAARGAAAVERAHHVEHAARRGDERAVAVLREAGEAIAPRTPSAAARWFHAALRLLPDESTHDVQRRELLVELASSLRGAGDLGACRESLRDALDLLPPEDARGRARLEAACATVESWLGRADEARRRLLRARRAVGEERTPEAIMLDTRLALDALNSLEFDPGAELAGSALSNARKLGDSALVAEAASALSLAHGLAGRVGPAREHHVEALTALEGLPEEVLADRIEIFFYLAWAENYIEEPELAISTAERGIALSRATAQGHLLVPLMLACALPNDLLGRVTESLKRTEEALAAARTSPNPQYLFWALWECAYSYTVAGDTERALTLIEESFEASRGLAPNFLSWSQPGTVYGWVLIQNGDPARGVPMYIEAAGGPEAPRFSTYERALAYQQIAEGLVTLGHLDEVAEYARRAEKLADQLDLAGPHALAAQIKAELLLAQDRPHEALDVARAARLPDNLRSDDANLLRLEALALAAMGDRKAAVTAFREAEREFASFPSVRFRDAVRRELRKLGARVEARGPATSSQDGLEALSRREREIAELVADRRTNKEIAGKLFLSDKTVETHLRNIFRKLSVSSRVEVARAVDRAQRLG